jgi:hypothetical protein
MSVTLPLHPDPQVPPLTVVAYYGSNLNSERTIHRKFLNPLLSMNAVIAGDFNATSRDTDVQGMGTIHWKWLMEQELNYTLIDAVRTLSPQPQHTHLRQYQGTSYIDRIYYTRLSSAFFPLTAIAYDSVGEASDHDKVESFFHPWGLKTPFELKCSFWQRRHVSLFQKLVSQQIIPQPPPERQPRRIFRMVYEVFRNPS